MNWKQSCSSLIQSHGKSWNLSARLRDLKADLQSEVSKSKLWIPVCVAGRSRSCQRFACKRSEMLTSQWWRWGLGATVWIHICPTYCFRTTACFNYSEKDVSHKTHSKLTQNACEDFQAIPARCLACFRHVALIPSSLLAFLQPVFGSECNFSESDIAGIVGSHLFINQVGF